MAEIRPSCSREMMHPMYSCDGRAVAVLAPVGENCPTERVCESREETRAEKLRLGALRVDAAQAHLREMRPRCALDRPRYAPTRRAPPSLVPSLPVP